MKSIIHRNKMMQIYVTVVMIQKKKTDISQKAQGLLIMIKTIVPSPTYDL